MGGETLLQDLLQAASLSPSVFVLGVAIVAAAVGSLARHPRGLRPWVFAAAAGAAFAPLGLACLLAGRHVVRSFSALASAGGGGIGSVSAMLFEARAILAAGLAFLMLALVTCLGPLLASARSAEPGAGPPATAPAAAWGAVALFLAAAGAASIAVRTHTSAGKLLFQVFAPDVVASSVGATGSEVSRLLAGSMLAGGVALALAAAAATVAFVFKPRVVAPGAWRAAALALLTAALALSAGLGVAVVSDVAVYRETALTGRFPR